MVAQESGPSFASILTILSIVMYTGGFLRVEVEFNKQKDKINALEKLVESMKTSNSDNIAQDGVETRVRFAFVARPWKDLEGEEDGGATPRKRASGWETIVYLREKAERDFDLKKEEMETRNI